MGKMDKRLVTNQLGNWNIDRTRKKCQGRADTKQEENIEDQDFTNIHTSEMGPVSSTSYPYTKYFSVLRTVPGIVCPPLSTARG